MAETDENATASVADSIVIDGQAFSLAELANMGWDEVDAVKTTRSPAGAYGFSIEESSLTVKEITDKEKNTKIKVMVIPVKLKMEACFGVVSPPGEDSIDPDSMIGKHHTETFFIKTGEAYGRFKQFCMDIGYVPPDPKTPFQDIVKGLTGYTFSGRIKHSPNKADSDSPYINLDLTKIKAWKPQE